ncbi:MAG: lysine--tRNA ligase [Nitrosopumilus sp. H13]|nr:MAG: lysine--tRNA ligase [Nitrosopumilus sp. H13]
MSVIGRGTWIDKLARELLEREEQLGRSLDMIRVESGLGASGIPHIGSLGDAVRAYGVKLALQDAGYKSELIAYSDDLDGLRKIPEGMPDSLKEHLAKPVSLIPDPYGCHDSYGMHMSSMLLDGLDRVGVKYEFRRAADTYKKGLLSEQIHTILQNSAKIGSKIAEMVGQSKYETSLPYFVVCENCERLYTTQSLEYIPDERKVRYSCKDAVIGDSQIPGCGHEGEADIARSLGKLAWKVEFAARWAAFDVRFEAYGKDIMDSVKVNDWVADEILRYAHPHHVKYEMFLDKGGKKISKSLGNVITAQKWLEFGTPESILLLLYKRITGARELGFDDIPGLMNEYNELEDVYFGRTKVENPAKLTKSRGLYEYVNLLEPPSVPGIHVNYMLAVELARIFKEDRVTRVVKKLTEYGVIKESDDVENLVSLAGRYSDEFDRQETVHIEIDDAAKKALRELAGKLAGSPGDIQNIIYDTAKSNGVPPRDFFRILYQIILGTTRGPKIGPFISDIGAQKTADAIMRHV